MTRTPFRISFFGGGTDYPIWYEKHGGAVLSTAIDKYCYITCRALPPFFNIKSRIVWSKIELVNEIEEIEHPAVKGVLKFFNLHDGLEIHHVADLPARAGLGASSSFAVGFLNAIYALQNKEVSKEKLVEDAINVERNIIGESVGSQDQVAAAHGGLNKVIFHKDGKIEVTAVNLAPEVLKGLRDHCLLYFTGHSRSASEVAAAQIKNTPNKENELHAMHGMVEESVGLLKKGDLEGFGKLLHESWQLKRGLSGLITTPQVDQIYGAARTAGAIGGKLLGAGGGGFMLIYADPSRHPAIKTALKDLLHVPFDFDTVGSKVIYRMS